MSEHVSEHALRAAELGDLPQLERLEQAAFAEEAWTREMLAEELCAPARHYVVLLNHQGGVIGYAGLFMGLEVGEVMTIGVDPAAQGSGLGRQLMDHLLDVARQAQLKAVMLEVAVNNQAATALYQSLGFRVTRLRRGYYQPSGTDANEMRLELR